MKSTGRIKQVFSKCISSMVAVATAATMVVGMYKTSDVISINGTSISASAATASYSTSTYNYGPNGGTCSYYNREISSCAPSASWLKVNCTGYGSFTVRASSTNDVRNYRSSRWGYVDFKDSKGKILKRVCVNQDYGYLDFNNVLGVVRPLNAQMLSKTYVYLSYNCPFEIDTSGNCMVFIKNGSGGDVKAGGSYSGYGKYKRVKLTITACDTNFGPSAKYANLNLYKRYTNNKSETCSIVQKSIFSNKNTYTCSNSMGGTIELSMPEAGTKMECRLRDFSIPIAISSYDYLRDKALLKFDSNSMLRGTMYLYPGEELQDNIDFYITIGTFTISEDGKTFTLNATGKKVGSDARLTYTYNLT